MVPERRLSSAFGFTCMLGGALFGVLLMAGTLLSDSLTATNEPVLGWMLTMAVLFLIPGAVGLYLVQRTAFSWPGHAASALFLLGLGGYSAVALLGLVGVTTPAPVATGTLALLGVGQFAFAAVTAWHDILAHGRSGGVLLGLAIPTSFAVPAALDAVGITSIWLATLSVAVPISGAWMLLGLDLLTASDGGVEARSAATDPAD